MATPAKRRKTSAAKARDPPNSSIEASDDVDKPQYPGFSPWHATLDIEGGSGEMSKFDNTKAEFMHSAKIYDTDAFKLKPVSEQLLGI